MRDASVYPPAGGWVITDQGREDWRTLPTCECKPVVQYGCVICPDCGTVYGDLRKWKASYEVISRKRD